MRFIGVVGLIPMLLVGCGAKYKPKGPVLTGYERAMDFPVQRSHANLTYYGREPFIAAPMLPVLAFGAAFELDLVVVPKAGDFEMLEFARIATPTEPLWVALETARDTGDQSLVANLDEIEGFMPEIPLPRKSTSLQATDNSTSELIDVTLSYENINGQMVEATMQGDPPEKLNRKRNGPAFNHSENQLLAVVDVPASESLFKANVQVEGKGLKLKRIGGIVPFQFAMEQAQGGLAVGQFSVIPTTPVAGSGNLENVMSVYGPEAPPPAPAPAPVPTMDPATKVRVGMAKKSPELKACYEASLVDNAELAGTIEVSLTLDAGAVTEAALAEVEGDDALVDEAMAACVVEMASKWVFDEGLSGTTSWPFSFAPAAEEGAAIEMSMGEGTSDLTMADASDDDGSGDAMDEEGGVDGASAERPDESLGDEDLVGDAMDEAKEGDDGGMGDDLMDDDEPEEADTAADPVIGLSNFRTVHAKANGTTVEMEWQVSRHGDRVTAVQSSDLRTLTYNYRVASGAYLELVTITVEQYGRGVPVTAITFSPPLPDLRRRFDNNRISSFVIDVNGQQNFAKGDVEVYWADGAAKVKVTPDSPDWTSERVMLTTIQYAAGSAQVAVERVRD